MKTFEVNEAKFPFPLPEYIPLHQHFDEVSFHLLFGDRAKACSSNRRDGGTVGGGAQVYTTRKLVVWTVYVNALLS